MEHGIAGDGAQFTIAQRDGPVFADIDGHKDLQEMLQRDHGVNHAGEGAVALVYAPCEHNNSMSTDTAH